MSSEIHDSPAPAPDVNLVSSAIYGPPTPEPDPSALSEPVYGPPAPEPGNLPDSITDVPGNILSWIGDVYANPQDHILLLVILCTVVLAAIGLVVLLIAGRKR